MQPEANYVNRKTVSRPALRADGSLLDFSISWLLHKQGDLWLEAACSVTATPPRAFRCPQCPVQKDPPIWQCWVTDSALSPRLRYSSS